MRLEGLIIAAIAAQRSMAAYPGDIVQYWVDQSSQFVNGTIIGGLQSPPSAWLAAVVHGTIYSAAVEASHENLDFQQLAVSHAAHDSLAWVFHGTRLYSSIDAALKAVITPIGIDPKSERGKKAAKIGQGAASKVAEKRATDHISNFVDFTYGPANPGVYQKTIGGAAIPDTPQAVFLRPFGGIEDVTKFRPPPPPASFDSKYETEVLYVKSQGDLNSTERKPFDTDTAYFWRESSIILWNRIANVLIGSSLSTKVVESAKFYAQLNYALANAGIAAWDTKYYYNAWRPETAIRRTDIWLKSGHNISSPNWTPLLRPTPSHPDYPSTHATFGGAAAAVLRAYNSGDKVQITVSSNVTLDSRGVITRTYTNLTEASLENAASRIFGGIHFRFAGSAGIALGDRVAKKTLELFDDNWEKF